MTADPAHEIEFSPIEDPAAAPAPVTPAAVITAAPAAEGAGTPDPIPAPVSSATNETAPSAIPVAVTDPSPELTASGLAVMTDTAVASLAQHAPEATGPVLVQTASNETPTLPPGAHAAAARAHAALSHLIKVAHGVQADLEKYLPPGFAQMAEKEVITLLRSAL